VVTESIVVSPRLEASTIGQMVGFANSTVARIPSGIHS